MLNGIDGIEGLTPEQLEQINKLASGLSSKNGDVIGDNKLLKAQVEQLENDKLEAKRKAAEDANNHEEVARLDKEAAAKALNDAQISAKENAEHATVYKSQLEVLLIDGGLSSALDGVKINPALKIGAVALLRSQAQVIDGKAMVGDKSLSDVVKEWADSDVGKAYCLAENNSGGGGRGDGGGGGGKTFAEMTLTEKTVLANENPTLYTQLKG